MKKKYSAVESENGSIIIPNNHGGGGLGSNMHSPDTRNPSNSNSVLSGSGGYPQHLMVNSNCSSTSSLSFKANGNVQPPSTRNKAKGVM